MIALLTPAARGQVVIGSNTLGTNTISLNGSGAIAIPLTVVTPAAVTSVEFRLSATSGTTVSVEIRQGTTPPGTLVASGVSTDAGTVIGTVSVPVTPSAPLLSGGSYWVIVRPISGGLQISNSTTQGIWTFNGTAWAAAPNFPAPYVVVRGVNTGACCSAISTACSVMSSTDCAGFGGTFVGFTTACAGTPCLPVGACCRSTACTLTTQVGCLTAQVGQPVGRWLGAGSACTPAGVPNACCPVDFDGSGQRSIDDIFIFLNGWFAGCP